MKIRALEGKNQLRATLALISVALLFAISIPVVSASTVNIALNPTTGIAKVTGISTTTIVFTYPANSSISNVLKNYSYSLSASGNIARGETSADDFQDTLRNYTPSITVQNMSTSLSTKAAGNSTALVVTRQTNITAWVTGVFNMTNGKVMANLEWKAFIIRGSFQVPMDGHEFELNMLGSAVTMPLGGSGMAQYFLTNSFGGENIWSRSTINFSSLNSSLANWTRVYNPATNTTTFTKNVKALANFSSETSLNGQKYSLSMVYDPSSTVSVAGYATPSGNSLIIESPPPGMNYTTTSALILIVLVVVAAAAYMAVRRRAKGMSVSSTQTPLTNYT